MTLKSSACSEVPNNRPGWNNRPMQNNFRGKNNRPGRNDRPKLFCCFHIFATCFTKTVSYLVFWHFQYTANVLIKVALYVTKVVGVESTTKEIEFAL